eukprot:9209319-Ditylum_brightwellii.AAC.1
MFYSIETFQKAVGFCNVELVLKHMQTVTQPTLCITNTRKGPVRDPGEMATLPQSDRNTSPIPRPKQFGNIFHYNIVYVAGTAIGGYHYTLWLVDRKTCLILVYPFKSLQEEEILCAVKLFVCDIGGSLPHKMIADRDFKLIGGTIHYYLAGVHLDSSECGSIVTGAPAG